MNKSSLRKLVAWFAGSDTGISSKHMAAIAAGVEGGRSYLLGCHPLDPSDLGRCIRLVDAVPEVRDAFPAIAASSPQWKAIIDHWDELVALPHRRELFLRTSHLQPHKGADPMKPQPKLITVAEALAGSHTNRLPCKPKPMRVTFIHRPTPRQLARPPSF